MKIRTFNILKRLSKDFDVRAMCFYRRAAHSTDAQVASAIEGLRPFADITAYPIPQEYSGVRAFWDHARSIASQRVFTRFAYESESYKRDLQRAFSEFQPHLIHMDSLDLSGYLPLLPANIPVVCVHHNVESFLLKRRAESSQGLKAWYFGLQARLTEREEQQFIPSMSLNIAVSDLDRELLGQIVGRATIQTIPNGVDTTQILPLSDASSGIVFVGGTTWFPNRDALEFFAKDVLPRITEKLGKEVPVTWVGHASKADQLHYRTHYGVMLTGYVDQIEQYIENAACYVVPLRIGGGTRLKILYAWAMGRAIVSTSVGCEGLDARDGENILVRDTPEAFASAVVDILNTTSLRRQLSERGRETAVSQYDWDVLTANMTALYKQCLLP